MVDDRGWIITVKLKHQQIANYATVTRETVTRVLDMLEKEVVTGNTDFGGKKRPLTKTFFALVKGAA